MSTYFHSPFLTRPHTIYPFYNFIFHVNSLLYIFLDQYAETSPSSFSFLMVRSTQCLTTLLLGTWIVYRFLLLQVISLHICLFYLLHICRYIPRSGTVDVFVILRGNPQMAFSIEFQHLHSDKQWMGVCFPALTKLYIVL